MRSALLNLSLEEPSVSNPVIPGDHPDPTILRVGQRYFASATSGEWSPQFPLFESPDLTHWSMTGAIFPIQPAWAEGSFWAPELVHDGKQFLAYYVARARGGPLSIAVATAASPRGPWTDHGPILAEPLGSIDPAFARDEHGDPFLIWKTDGNSEQKPTPIWAQPLTPDLLHLTGTPTQLITNDEPWEGGVVEGPYILRHEGRFYLFYAANACCGRECQYAEGVARADRLLGPWEKNPANPIIADNHGWRCPGHGTIVHGHTAPGETYQDYLLYHAYPREGTIYIGREAVLDQIAWSPDGWPTINAGQGPNERGLDRLAPVDFEDNFESRTLAPSWQWPVNTYPTITTGHGELHLTIPANRQSAMIAVPAPAIPGYTATVSLCTAAEPSVVLSSDSAQPDTPTYNPPPETTWSGLSIVGDPFNTIGLGLRRGDLELWQRKGDTSQIVWSQPIDRPETPLWLRVFSSGDLKLDFSWSHDQQTWSKAGDTIDASDLPAWDRGLRIGLMIEGPGRGTVTFRHFLLKAG
ncbi:family 43 glycosylhydrolase [Granulicella sibirica]|uniref:Beta-xylosidase n=1 Tax=Granulicella sibirica TaxID=2479048 RepID=A0A4Q0T855_9BACT|nr:family 43 glycosylhydrolase [Granulicella sibirica]RXH57791.1 Beta-xylosidase [Granulicella sibirica]